MKAVILAAGLASRLRPLTEARPKCLLELHGQMIIDYQLAVLRSADITEVVVIVGHMGDKIRDAIGERVNYATYADYEKTNNLYTLHACAEHLDDDCVVMFSDVLIPEPAMQKLVGTPDDFALLVDTRQVLAGTMRIKVADGGITDLGGHIPVDAGIGNFVGIAKYSRAGAEKLRGEMQRMVDESGHEQEYYVQALPRLAAAGLRITPLEIGTPWLEVDDVNDYAKAKEQTFYMSEPSPLTSTGNA